MRTILRIFLLVLPLIFSAPAASFALAGDWQSDEALSVRLISGVEGTGQLAAVPLGLEVKLSPDWHTYWRSPGQAGLPPQFNWEKSQSDEANLKSAALLYPAPKRYTAFGLETVGYRDYAVFPIDAEVRIPGKPLVIDTALDILVCSKLCVPKHFELKLTVPAGPATDSPEASILKQYRGMVPENGGKIGLAIHTIVFNPDSVTVEILSQGPLTSPDLFVENDKYIDFSAPAVEIATDKTSAKLTVKPVMPLPADIALSSLSYTFTVTDGNRAMEGPPPVVQAPKESPTVPAAEPKEKIASSYAAASAMPLAFIVLFAIIGGFILNLMPCVLPVLSLKILSVVSHGGGDASVVRHSFLVTAAGILFSFLVLAAATVGLKEAGLAVGWGVQYQQPVFLGFLVLLLTFFAANMWGLFEIRLPRWLADNFSGPYHPKLAGDFATGAFATLLATPCSAPFLGTAVGFALASGPWHILLIFAALGFGMMLPYLAVALVPRLATALPKPGAWMMHLRHLLAWALALTAAWLVWVLAAQISERRAIVFALCMLAIIGLFALNNIKPRRYLILGIASFAILAFGTAVAGSLAPKPPAAVEEGWVPFDENKIAADVESGKTVFVDVTADWCLTCKANKKLVLTRPDIKNLLSGASIVPMLADWTNPDPAISTFLEKHKRFGIPFNIVFGPGAKEGIVLPELLTPDAVRDAFAQAGKAP